jgi:rhamnosyltransferase
MKGSQHVSIGVAVLTYQAVAHLPNCLSPILASPLKPKVLVIDSSSNDGTVELAHEMGVETIVIPPFEFNHGTTRELARRALGTDIVVMLTQDVIPAGVEMLRHLVRPIVEGTAAIAYARQIPRDGADFFEAYARSFNYPATSELRSIEEIHKWGPYTFFCSNSCCGWSNAALAGVGGFERTLASEDVIATAKLLRAGHKIAYCADAIVKHSHRYTLKQEFCRYFDTGYVRAEHKALLFTAGGDERRGIAFVRRMLRRLALESPQLIPYALLVASTKFLGYRVGYHGHVLPVWLKRRCSGQKYFW